MSCIGTCHLLETAERLLYLSINFDSVGFFFFFERFTMHPLVVGGFFWG